MSMAPAPMVIYPVAYAARLAGLDTNTARRWVRGYAYGPKGQRRQGAPVLQLAPAGKEGQLGLTFEQLLTLRLVRAFREKGLGLPTIKKAAQEAVTRYGIKNPFVSRAFRSDGRSVFIELTKRGDLRGDEQLMVNALTGQHQFREVVEPSLFQDVVFTGDVPSQWFPLGRQHAVVIRPDRAFGAPHVADSGVRTDVIAEAVTAEGGSEAAIARVASWFGIAEAGVRDALAAEAQWQTPKAA
ncbi:hypothetical protein [Pseudoroseomonas sp. WGS1072]|uniref:hypothetical protein n=1 Tax=Roseomonas sp. WGS1072 TaxID=3366816 RepID=UPI003BF4443F